MPQWGGWESSSSSNDAWGYRFETWSASSSKDSWGKPSWDEPSWGHPTTPKPTTSKPTTPSPTPPPPAPLEVTVTDVGPIAGAFIVEPADEISDKDLQQLRAEIDELKQLLLGEAEDVIEEIVAEETTTTTNNNEPPPVVAENNGYRRLQKVVL